MSFETAPGKETLKSIQKRLRDRPELFLGPFVDCIHVIDRNGFLIDFCESFARGLGYSRDEMEGLHVSAWNVSWSPSELLETVRAQSARPPGETATFETIHRRKDGTLVPVEIKVLTLLVDNQPYLLSSSRDLSAKQLSESRIHQLSELNILLASAGAAVSEARDEALFLQTLCDLCVRHGEMSLAWIGSPDDDGVLRFQAAAGALSYLEGLRITINAGEAEGEGPTGLSFRENRPYFNNDFDAPFLKPWKEKALRLGIRSNATFPIQHEGRVWGILAVYHRGKEAFSSEVQDLLVELSRIVSRGLTLVMNRRMEKETALLQEALLDNTIAGIALVRENRFMMANARFRELFGFGDEDLSTSSVRDILAGERNTLWVFSLEGKSARKEVHLFPDIKVRKRDGTEFHVDLSTRPLSGSETTVWTVVDVSERHELQEKNIRISRFNLMLARANHAIATLSDEEELLKELCDLGVSTGDLDLAGVGVPDERGYLRILASAGKREFLEGVRYSVREDQPEGLGAVGLAWRTGSPQFNETFAAQSFWKDRARTFGFRSGGALPVLRNGKSWGVFFVYYRQENVLLSDLKVILEELVTNVSRGLDLIELQRFRSLLSRALAVVSDGAVITGIDRKVRYANRSFSKITGYEAREVSNRECRMLVGPGSDPGVCADIERAIDAGQPYEGEILHYRKDGTPFWNHLAITPIRNETGKLTHFLEIHRDVTQVRLLADRLSFESRHDDLTGLPNRRSLESHLDRVLARAGRHGTSVAVGVIDLNNFKPVNDLHGHGAGDSLLREFSMRVRTKLRESDFLARLGGDEFVLVIDDLPQGVTESQIGVILDRLHEAVESPFPLPSGETVSVGMSLGIALFPEDGQEGDELLRKADLSMYGVKDRKRRQITWWQRGTELDAPDSDSSFDPYGPDTIALLETHQQELQKLQERFVEDFYRELAGNPDAQSVLGIMSKEELDALKTSQIQYLTELLNPESPTEERWEKSRHLGEIHALTGVPDHLLIRSKFLYSRLLIEHMNRSRLAPKDRLHLYLAIEIRLDRDFEVQIDASKATIDRYFGSLSLPLSRDEGGEGQSNQELDRLARLPGIRAVGYLEGKGGKTKQIQRAAGECKEACELLFKAEGGETHLAAYPIHEAVSESLETGRHQSLGRLIPGVTSSSFDTWLKTNRLRSLLVIPVINRERAEGVLVLFGSYPNQFESPWMQRFASGVAIRWAGLGNAVPLPYSLFS